MNPIDGKAVLDLLARRRAKLAAAGECGGCMVELIDKIIKEIRQLPALAGWFHAEELVPLRYPEASYPARLYRIGEKEIAVHLERLQAELQTHEAMFLRMAQLQREKEALVKTIWGDCDYCANKARCAAYTCYCIAGNAWDWEGVRKEKMSNE